MPPAATSRPSLHPALQAPIDRYTHVVLRHAVLDLLEADSRRRFPSVLHAGVPGRCTTHPVEPGPAGARLDAEVDAGLDAGLRADVVLALLRRASVLTTRPVVWLTRPGELTPHDTDLRWVGPTAWAASALGLPVGLVVVTRRGWFDPVSDVRREWRRLRRH
ncbi:hypothetical protein SAMN04489844_3525 [Nocardioides exalbidus]|uniref:Uncharacterized protein n=1 Tax=Nocardioides exalbidus TaxID=402596 RepID=A0A1H4XCZ5_9ACTN|nr:hypothetical protein [Nocardioides exalbidus]SED03457.1 hypothetical protein SAMN04489844_3525 [Nocardioides exalbidus]